MTDTVLPLSANAKTEADIDPTLDLVEAINALRKEKNAVILAHYYQEGEIQDLADFVGDSLDLSRKAAATDADMIVFCGVRFMGEVAKILSPGKIVVIPDAEAGCSLEESCRPEPFAAFRAKHPDHVAVTYINCSADIKALSDVIVTSSNAEVIVNSLPKDKPILFAPDRHLGAFIAKKTGRDMTLWPGSCIIHEQFSEKELVKLKTRNPKALVAAHPECPESVLRHADYIGSTKGILDYVIKTDNQEFIIATEPHIIHQMTKAAPTKTFIPAPFAEGACASCADCPFMAKNTLEKIYLAMLNEGPALQVPEELRTQALKPLERMLELSASVPMGGSSNAQ
ncbi:quinolinate synthase NadA [Magnetospirillum sp. 64-120]|mgnify:FL=1|uniref:quinolinate synthase NadA n=1 Tax=Magnetospirillum sp. 64-120 TaxID=1895778 RepID=UPI00092C1C9A|nr:quinolinate synthase NadA [Magnetospirillum sp. 64-120]OJX79566.1 MAG: quinolinate synthase [Magnetospirillum sp. 64-120]